MPKADDSSLAENDRRFVEGRARHLLDRANAWNRYPTNVGDILDAANLKVASTSIFDPAAIMAYLHAKGAEAASTVKAALSKVFGLYDGYENTIHIDSTVVVPKQTFLKLHEAGHHELPTHRGIFRFFQDCEQTLRPDIADKFEREANNFARFALFQGDGFSRMAADEKIEIKTAMKLGRKFGASVYASVREYARTSRHTCVAYVLEPIQFIAEGGVSALVRRIEPSTGFAFRFGNPNDTLIDSTHPLSRLLPVDRKMTRPTSFSLTDRNGDRHEVVGEAFDTGYNILVFIVLTADLALAPVGLTGKPKILLAHPFIVR